ncbi:MAG: metal ABC transporter permease [Spirochaeta sp.]
MILLEPVIDGITTVLMFFINLLPDMISDPFQYAFMQRALLTSLVVGTVCGVLSCYVVLKRWALLGDAISHAVLPGVALAYLLGAPLFIGAFISGSVTSIGIGFLQRNTRIKEDSAMGILFTATFALGVVLISRIATSTHLMHILFGNVLGVSTQLLATTMITGVLALACVLLFYKPLLLYCFDPTHASAIGMPTGVIHYGLMLLLTLTIVTSLETVGVILVVAMLIIPGATASMLTHRLPVMMAISAGVGAASAAFGLYFSFILNVASGGTIVLVAFTLFALTAIVAPEGPVRGRKLHRS